MYVIGGWKLTLSEKVPLKRCNENEFLFQFRFARDIIFIIIIIKILRSQLPNHTKKGITV